MIKRIPLLMLLLLLIANSASANTGLVPILWRFYGATGAPWLDKAGNACAWFNSQDPYETWEAQADDTIAAQYRCVSVAIPGANGSSGLRHSLEYQLGCTGNLKPDTTKPADQQCPDPPKKCSDTTNKFNRKFYYLKEPAYTPEHFGECSITEPVMLACNTDKTGKYCYWQFKQSGNLYTGSDPAPDYGSNGSGSSDDTTPKVDDAPATSPQLHNRAADPKMCATCMPCPQGTTQFGLDSLNIPICVGEGTSPGSGTTKTPTVTTSPDQTTQNSDGSTTTIGTQKQANADGSTTTTTTTTVVAKDGTKTVSISKSTGQTSDGLNGKADSTSQNKDGLCQQNPNLTICRNSSVSGTCGAITCNGDAIQCATLKATAQMQCKQQSDDDAMKASSEYALGKAVMSGNDPAAGTLPDPKKADTVTMGSGDATGWLGAGSYFKDKTISIPGGGSIVLPFSQGQSVMLGLRYVTMIVCSLVSFAIIRGTVNRS